MKAKADILMLNNRKNDIGHTSTGDESSKRKRFSTISLPKLVAEIQNKSFEKFTAESDILEGQGMKIDISSINIHIWTTLKILLLLKLSCHSDILTEASNLIDEVKKRGEIENEHQYQI